jgi:probable rRNA maturation factor
MFTIDINNQQTLCPVDADRLRRTMEAVLEEEGVQSATIHVAIVDDPAIHSLNRRFLDHDEPTDVLSFLMNEGSELEGDVIASIETAARAAEAYGWTIGDELLLYVLHGTLHLVGYDDLDPESQARMRARERYYLAAVGLTLRYDEWETCAESAGYPGSAPADRRSCEESRP